MKKCKECGRDEWGFLSVLNDDGYCPTCAIVHNEEKIKKLQEQLKEANDVIKVFRKENWRYGGEFIGISGSYSCAQAYLDKWGVK